MTQQDDITETQDEIIGLRCNKCGKLITPATAVKTPTGYRCKECVRAQQKTFNTAKPIDLLIAFVIAAAIAFAGSWLTQKIGFFTFLLAPAAGTLIANLVRLATKKRRSKGLFLMVLYGSIAGGLIIPILFLWSFLAAVVQGRLITSGLIQLLWLILFIILCAPSAYMQVSGIRLRR
jgi:hypothetical protein